MKLIKKLRQLLNYNTSLENIRSRAFFDYKADLLTQQALHYNEKGISDTKYCEQEIIVSLTTYGKRLYDVFLAIESIMQGSIKPNRIILWLANELESKELPQTIQNQQKRGLEVRYCQDIRSYTKLIPALRQFPNAAIITIDDDLIYSFDMVEKLIQAYKTNPSYIYANRIHQIQLDKNGKPDTYFLWKWTVQSEDISPLNFMTGCGGVLYPPRCMADEVLDEKVFMDICKYADDIWFYAMALKKGTGIKKVYTHNPKGEEYIMNPYIQDVGLFNQNLRSGQCGNDIQLKAVFDKYNLYPLLRK